MNLLKSSILFLLAFNMLISSSVASDSFTNGDFETGDFTGWNISQSHPSYQPSIKTVAGYGNYTCYLRGNYQSGSLPCIVFQEYDSNLYGSIQFDLYAGPADGSDDVWVHVFDNGTALWSHKYEENGWNDNVTVNISSYTGTGRLRVMSTSVGTTYLDNVILNTEGAIPKETPEPTPTPTPTPEPTEEPFIFTPSNITEYLSYFSIIITWVGVSFILILHVLLDSVLLILIGIFIGIMLTTYAYRLYKSR